MAKKIGTPEIAAVHVENVVRIVAGATIEQYAAGAAWYANTADSIAAHGAVYGYDAAASLAVFAILSPRNTVLRNLRDARTVLAESSTDSIVFVTGVARGKIAKILTGEDPGTLVSGQKINSFWHNLLGDYTRVTVDRHAASVVFNDPGFDKVTRAQYLYCTRVYTMAADYFPSLEPAQVQAIAWTAWRAAKLSAMLARKESGSPDRYDAIHIHGLAG